MGTRYTNSDIEIHLADYTVGLSDGSMPREALDEQATQDKAEVLIREALEQAYPDYSIAIFSQRHTVGASDEVVGYPDDVDPADVLALVERAVNLEHGGEEWIVTRPVYDTLAEAWAAGETWVEAVNTRSYVVDVSESTDWVFADDDETDEGYQVDGYLLTVSDGAMPPHFSKFFLTLPEVEAYLVAGEVLHMTTFRWMPTDEQ